MVIATMARRRLLGGICLAALSTAGFAQTDAAAPPAAGGEQPAGDAPAQDQGEIIVTGSRIVRDGYKQPTPVTTLTNDQLKLGAPGNIADGLNQLPQIQNSLSPTQTISVNSNVPAVSNNINLRGVDSIRGLVLLDGLRVPPTAFDGTIDVGILPQMLVSRVDVVTAGASAVYGSDAISGVVNYVLDRRFKGVKLEAQKSISTYGDAPASKLGIAAGGTALDGRLHLMGSAEYYNSRGLPDASQRPLFDQVYGVVGAGTAASPYRNLPNVRFGTVTFGGKPNGALTGGQFVGGAFVPFDRGTPVNNNLQIGGDGAYFSTKSLTGALKTNNLFGRASFDLSPTVSLYAQGSYGRVISNFDCCENFSLTPFTLFADNAYLPANARALLAAAGQSSFGMTRIYRDLGRIHVKTDNKSFVATTGIEAKLLDWNLSGHYTRGESRMTSIEANQVEWRKFYAAADAVSDGAGNIVCRVSLTNPVLYPGCVPINLFGNGSPSQAAKQYVTGDGIYKTRNILNEAELSLSGDLFQLNGKAVSLAVGASYRDQSLDVDSNSNPAVAIDFTGLRGVGARSRFQHTNVGNTSGKENVKEGFAELAVPVLADLPFARRLDLDGAVRYADYSVSGGAWTWKLGGRYEPFDGFTIRAARSHDFRAPTLNNLFAGSTLSFSNLADKQSGVTATVNTVQSGNPALKPETGDTTTLGFVYQAKWLPGLALSVDLYRLKITDAIIALSAPQLADICFASGGTDRACSQITRSGPNQFPSSVFIGPVNVGRILTQGIDIDASYRAEIGDGGIAIRALINYMDKYDVQSGANSAVQHFAGAVDTSVSLTKGRNRVRAALSANLTQGPFSIFVQERYLSAIRRNFNPSIIYEQPKIPAYFYTDLTTSVSVGPKKQLQLYVTVNNLFNKQPPIFPTHIFQQNLWYPTVQTTYDVVGRYMTFGLRAKF